MKTLASAARHRIRRALLVVAALLEGVVALVPAEVLRLTTRKATKLQLRRVRLGQP